MVGVGLWVLVGCMVGVGVGGQRMVGGPQCVGNPLVTTAPALPQFLRLRGGMTSRKIVKSDPFQCCDGGHAVL